MRRFFGGLGALGAGAVSILLYLAAPAAAQVEGSCAATFDGVNVRQFATPGTAKQVGSSGKLTVEAGAQSTLLEYPYVVQLELAGAKWTVESGITAGGRFSQVVDVAKYANRGAGIYKVIAILKYDVNKACYGRAYVEVDGGGALGTTAGQAAAATGIAGAGGLAVTANRARKAIDEKLVAEKSFEWMGSHGGDDAAATREAKQDRTDADSAALAVFATERVSTKFCMSALIVAGALTVRAVFSDAAHQAAAVIKGVWR